uniref:DUF4408 domain-containing protein n=1 Tax=Cajanus cajan TaxID=3821 RepID=A0A151RWB2_CAJCA|nr:hypothetical protein KK1_031537 [Cajanus cajan]
MAKPLYLEEEYYKPKEYVSTYPKAKSLSFLASIFSLFIYICIFYTFNLSPYSLLNNNIFWFFMSNTLILIIAVDYGAFSSSKQKQDLYEEYVQHSQARNYVSSYDAKVDKQCIIPKQKLGDGSENFVEKAIPARIFRRSKSDRHNRAKHVVHEARVNKVKKSETMKVEASVEEENNEFSIMSNEDLNRRIEEFIQKFNRQIRSQATRDV